MAFSRTYTLRSPSGMEVTLLEAGAAIAAVRAADRFGQLANVALPPEGLDDPSYAGATLAPYAGRIGGGKLRVDGQTIQLSTNEGNNQLHGGAGSLAKRLWRCAGQKEAAHFQEVSFSAEAADGLDGFPGNRLFTVTYRLYDDCRLALTLSAETDRPTRVNLSNHAYWNLSGDFSADVSRHLLQVEAERVYLNDDAFLVRGCEPVPPALDFRRARALGGLRGDAQLEAARGLNHCYVLSPRAGKPAATLLEPGSGRRLRLYTDQPCVMVYSGGFLPVPGCAVALEAQEHPESPLSPMPLTLYPGQVYRRSMAYVLDTAEA